MRILHAPENIGGMAGVLARAQKGLGYRARSFCPVSNHFKYHVDSTLKNPNSFMEKALAVLRCVWEFDVFHFYFGRSLLGDQLLDVLPLTLMGKKVFFYFCGCDIRDEKATTFNYSVSACANCFPKLCSPNRSRARDIAERYGRVNFVSTPDLLEFLPRSVLLPQAVDLDLVDEVLREPAPPRDPNRFVLAHAPTNRQIKGTKYLLDCVERLRKRGYAIDLLLIEGRSHAEALRAYRAADLAVDQLLVGSYGLLAAELMAMGVPTVSYLRPDCLRHYPEVPPIINANPASLESVLLDCYEHRDRLDRCRAAGQSYARKVHDPVQLARRCLEAYHQ